MTLILYIGVVIICWGREQPNSIIIIIIKWYLGSTKVLVYLFIDGCTTKINLPIHTLNI